MIKNYPRILIDNKALSRLTVTLFMFIAAAAVLGALAFVMKHSKDLEPADLLSFERLKRLFAGKKPVITAEEAGKIRSIVSGGESGGLVVEPPPGSAGADTRQASGPKADEVILRNGDVITGEIVSERLALATEHGPMGFRFSDIAAAYCVYDIDKPYDRVITRNGDRVSGKFADGFVRLKTAGGDVVNIAVGRIKIINKNMHGK